MKERKVVKSREQIQVEKGFPNPNCPFTRDDRRMEELMVARIHTIMAGTGYYFTPVRILKSEGATVVFWKDGTKTVVRCAPGTVPSEYDAFTAALGIKIFGSNSALKKLIQRNTVLQEPKRKKFKPHSCAGKDYCELDESGFPAPEEPESFDSAE